ncbi:hypothetical protein, partial [Streptomyces sp. NPDC057382]|uniref:hypothetical protein n=1 Tax=Streptomyces sp. NPDC057382 TaxID=3346112 RepID=UPI003627A331
PCCVRRLGTPARQGRPFRPVDRPPGRKPSQVLCRNRNKPCGPGAGRPDWNRPRHEHPEEPG